MPSGCFRISKRKTPRTPVCPSASQSIWPAPAVSTKRRNAPARWPASAPRIGTSGGCSRRFSSRRGMPPAGRRSCAICSRRMRMTRARARHSSNLSFESGASPTREPCSKPPGRKARPMPAPRRRSPGRRSSSASSPFWRRTTRRRKRLSSLSRSPFRREPLPADPIRREPFRGELFRGEARGRRGFCWGSPGRPKTSRMVSRGRRPPPPPTRAARSGKRRLPSFASARESVPRPKKRCPSWRPPRMWNGCSRQPTSMPA